MKKLKLNQLEKAVLNNRELAQIKGGGTYCGCGCVGSSSTEDNGFTNSADGKYSGTENDQIFCTMKEVECCI